MTLLYGKLAFQALCRSACKPQPETEATSESSTIISLCTKIMNASYARYRC